MPYEVLSYKERTVSYVAISAAWMVLLAWLGYRRLLCASYKYEIDDVANIDLNYRNTLRYV
jgi:hypothetical protein